MELSGHYLRQLLDQKPDRFPICPGTISPSELYNDQPLAATLRLALVNGDLLVAQGELLNGRVARFHKPPDPKQLWTEESLLW